MSTRQIGLYSARAACLYGHIIYLDEHGNKVTVTAVCEEGKEDNYNWSDKVVVGPVTKFVASTIKPVFPSDI
jgi:cellobiose-specific phosphotransferase system component IIB